MHLFINVLKSLPQVFRGKLVLWYITTVPRKNYFPPILGEDIIDKLGNKLVVSYI